MKTKDLKVIISFITFDIIQSSISALGKKLVKAQSAEIEGKRNETRQAYNLKLVGSVLILIGTCTTIKTPHFPSILSYEKHQSPYSMA